MTQMSSAPDEGPAGDVRRIGYKVFDSHDESKANDAAMRFAEAEVLAHPARRLVNISNAMSKYAKDKRSRHAVTVWYAY